MFVGSLVGWLVCSSTGYALCDLSRSRSPICVKFWHRCSSSMHNFTVDFWKVKVKVQGQNRRPPNNLPQLGCGLRYRPIRQIWQSNRSNLFCHEIWFLIKFKMAVWRKFALSDLLINYYKCKALAEYYSFLFTVIILAI